MPIAWYNGSEGKLGGANRTKHRLFTTGPRAPCGGIHAPEGRRPMEWLFGLEVMGIMLILRIALPMAIMALLIHALHRLDAGWQAAA